MRMVDSILTMIKKRDEVLFQTARLINERTYVNIILHDYLRVILGINQVESLWTLDWHPTPPLFPLFFYKSSFSPLF